MKDKIPIIIDTDPGIDDAVAIAIALFSDCFDIKLFTTVAGNVSLNLVTQNLLKLLKFWDKKIPVAKGASAPLLERFVDASNVHGSSGMDGYDFPKPDKKLLLTEHAVNVIYQVCRNSDKKITIVAIGPLTNIALLLKLYPDVVNYIEKIVLMGGALGRGNKGVLAEFNIATDPEAAKIVFESKLPLVMVSLDVGLKALVYPEDSAIIKELNKTGDMIYQLFLKYRGGSFNTGLKMYDSCAIAYLLKPELFEVVNTYVTVEVNGKYTKGATLVDLKNYLKQPPNCLVTTNVDPKKFRKWFINALKKCQ